jgi:hypothetical protein
MSIDQITHHQMTEMENKEWKSCGQTGHGHGYPGIHTQECCNTTKACQNAKSP